MSKADFKFGPRIAAPDYAKITTDAQQQVLKELGLDRPENVVAMARPDLLLEKASQIVQQADAELGLHLAERDKAIGHLWFYEQRLGLAKSAGLTHTGYRNVLSVVLHGNKKQPVGDFRTVPELVAAAEAAGVERVDNAEQKLLEAAPIVVAARARRETAIRYQHDAVLALLRPPYKWSTDKIADLAGIDRKLVLRQKYAAEKRETA
ncbi:hypothetical protein ABTY59_32125 [Streptomyces sp. NPDC096079]|uniref:hypothetical protein n=1 Tax=Streptomyces sp. NPDC096079 TaxID=3155820 RepID=UPI0033181064